MSALERRVQLLLDQARYNALQREADRSHQSVNAVIRESIDLRLKQPATDMAGAVTDFLSTADGGPGRGEDWDDIKAEIEQGILDRSSDT